MSLVSGISGLLRPNLNPAAPPIAPATPVPAAIPGAGSDADTLRWLTSGLSAAAPHADPAVWVPALLPELAAAGIVTRRRIAALLGQCSVEAGNGFSHLAEDLFYTTPRHLMDVYPSRITNLGLAYGLCRNPVALGNVVYANRLGNGDVASGDGGRFSGHGLIQLTGRAAWEAFGATRGMTAEQAVAFGATVPGAAASACWFWTNRKLNPLADFWQLTAITGSVNGPAKLGLQARISASNAALTAMGA